MTGRVLVHAGWPKTATTSLQRQLRVWPNLAGRPLDRPGGAEAKLLMRKLVTGDEVGPAELSQFLERSWHDRSTIVVLSNEGFIGTPRWQTTNRRSEPVDIARRLAGTDWSVTVLATLREPRAMVRSCYRFAVRGGFAGGYATYLDDRLRERSASLGPFSLRRVLEAYDELLGVESVVVAWMEDLVSDPQHFWADVSVRTGSDELSALGAEPLSHMNPTRLGPEWFELGLNRMLAVHAGRRRSRAGRRIRRAYTAGPARWWSPSRRPEIPASVAGAEDELVAAMEDDITWICDRYGVDRPYERDPRELGT